MAENPRLYNLMANADDRRERIRQHAVDGLKSIFPIIDAGYVVDVKDYEVSKEKFAPSVQKMALLEGRTLVEPLKGTVTIADEKTGKILDTSRRTLLHLPYFTERHTFIMGGNDYSVANQVRIKPGVYTRRRENGELEANFNLSKGKNFRLSMDPERGVFFQEYGTTRIPLYATLQLLGVSDSEMFQRWGQDLTNVNKSYVSGKEQMYMRRLYDKIIPTYGQKPGATADEVKADVIEALKHTQMDPSVTNITLGTGFGQVEGPALLRASEKLLNVYKGKEEGDDRDSLAFKTIHTVETFVKERIEKDAGREVKRKVKTNLRRLGYNDPTVSGILPSAPFTKSVHNFLTTSALAAMPMQINPMEILDSAVKVTALGEGGISSTLAVPHEARDVHSSHMGIFDPVRTPESGKAGVDIRATIHMARDDEGNMYAPFMNTRTGRSEYVRADRLEGKTVAFPNQRMTGRKHVDALIDGKMRSVLPSKVDYHVGSPHSMYSPATTLVPFPESAQGNRNVLGAKMQTQSLPLKTREAPYVQVQSWRGGADNTMEAEFGNLILPTSPVDGRVEKIDGDFVYIRPTRTKKSNAPSAVIIKGNPRFITDNPQADAFYAAIQQHLADQGYSVEMDPGEPYTSPPDADLWIGHSRGAGRIQYAPEGTKTLAFGSHHPGAINHPEDVVDMQGLPPEQHPAPNQHHYAFTDAMREAINAITPTKTASANDLVKVPYAQMFPMASKTYLNDDLGVKVGDPVRSGQVLADNNFTRDGKLALGKNLAVAYMPYYGYNSNDAVVISAGASEKLTSLHMYKEMLPLDSTTVLSLDKHKAYFGSKYTGSQYAKLEANGVARRGSRVDHGDLLVAALRTAQPTARASMLGNLHKSLVKPYNDSSLTWDHESPGEIVDVVVTGDRVTLTVKTEEPMRVGDKLSGRYGNKGVVSRIVSDDQMVKDQTGRPIDVLMTSAGIISRINPSQIIETAVGKVAEKTGVPIVVAPYMDRDNVQWAKDLLKEHNISDKETVFDPVSNMQIPNIHVGRQYIFKLFKSTDTNFAARGIGPGYDSNLQPSKGGDMGAKSIGKMEFNGLIAHNARNILKETAMVKGQRNDEYWRRVQLGLPATTPTQNFSYDKFQHMLSGAGVKVNKDGTRLSLAPLTDRDIDAMAPQAIRNALLVKPRMVRGMPQIVPEKGGLFDPGATGGLEGNKYSKINLVEPVVNPVFHEPARRLLEMSNKEFETTRNARGAYWIKEQLNQLDLTAEEARLREAATNRSGSARDDAVKRIKYIQALKREDLRAGDAYVLTKIPVVPPAVRPVMPNRDGTTLVSDTNYLYRDLMLANEAISGMPEALRTPDEMVKQRGHLHDAVSALFGMGDPVSPQNQGRGVKGHIAQITGTSSPKGGYFQSRIMSRRQDLSGRGTIAPDHTLDMDQVGLPETMGWRMYEPFIVKRLIQQGYPALEAREKVKDKAPVARRALEAEIQSRPVILNRAPSLHRFNIISAFPQLIPGKTIRLNPFAESGMNADYDGDAMQMHVPVSDGAVSDAKAMTLSNLIFGDRSKDDLMVFPAHEALIGAYMATRDQPTGTTRRFKDKGEAMEAYRKGEITMATPVVIGK